MIRVRDRVRVRLGLGLRRNYFVEVRDENGATYVTHNNRMFTLSA